MQYTFVSDKEFDAVHLIEIINPPSHNLIMKIKIVNAQGNSSKLII